MVTSIESLRRAYIAAESGEFDEASPPTAGTPPHRRRAGQKWTPAPSEAVHLVLGAHGGAGASTVALALATAATDARVVECCTVGASGLAGAADAELGKTAAGWVQGSRGQVLIERRGDRIATVTELPHPERGGKPVTVMDCTTDIDLLITTTGWLADLARALPKVVVVAQATVPGIRRLEAAIGLLGVDRVSPVLVGVGRRWPRPVEQAAGPHVRQLRAAGVLICVPTDRTLAVAGVTPEPLPAAVVAACSGLVTHLVGGNL